MYPDADDSEKQMVAGIIDDVDRFFAVTIEVVREETMNDTVLRALLGYVANGFPASAHDMPAGASKYWQFRHDMSADNGVLVYNDRVVIPSSLRNRVLENLHSAHQGTTNMTSRAQSCIFWPGMSADIQKTRDHCKTCNRNAPSQARLPPQQPRVPKSPFELICADYFKLRGKQYLVIADRLSGWPEILKVPPGSPSSGSKGLCNALRCVFASFGAPEEITSDGGPEFVSDETKDFLARWGTQHRLSSAYFPSQMDVPKLL